MLKKVLSLAAFVAMLTVSSYAQQTPVKLSLYDQIAWPNKAETSNAVLGLIDSNTPTIYGIDWNFISARAGVMHGYQAAFVYNRANEMMGLQKAIYTLADEASGVQL